MENQLDQAVNYTNALGLVCVSSSLLFYISPFANIFQVIKAKDTTKEPKSSYLLLLVFNLLALIWSIKLSELENLVTSVVGASACSFFLAVCVYFGSGSLLAFTAEFALYASGLGALSYYFFLIDEDIRNLEFAMSGFNTLASLSSLGSVYKAISNKDRRFIPIVPMIAQAASCFLWASLGILKGWGFVVNFPTYLALGLALLQVLLYFTPCVKSSDSKGKVE